MRSIKLLLLSLILSGCVSTGGIAPKSSPPVEAEIRCEQISFDKYDCTILDFGPSGKADKSGNYLFGKLIYKVVIWVGGTVAQDMIKDEVVSWYRKNYNSDPYKDFKFYILSKGQ